jgi:hypothetical protein
MTIVLPMTRVDLLFGLADLNNFGLGPMVKTSTVQQGNVFSKLSFTSFCLASASALLAILTIFYAYVIVHSNITIRF